MIEYTRQEKTLERPFTFDAIGDVLQLAPEFPVRGIRVDNYTDRWLYCDTNKRYIPPLGLGWQAFLEPSATSIAMSYVNPPDGAAPRPRLGGLQALIKLFERPLPDSEGVPFGLGVVTIPYAPVEALSVRAVLTTNGSVNTSKTDVILAAPGVGFRYRLWGWNMSHTTSSSALYRVLLLDDASHAYVDGLMANDPTTGFFPFGTHGVQLPEDSALSVRSWCNQSGRSLFVTAHYSIEATT